MPRIIALLILLACINAGAEPRMIPDDFPRFIVPEHQKQMDSLRALYWLHYKNNGPQATLWDEWLPPATLWPAAGSGEALDDMRRRWSAALSARRIDDEGYVSTHQHPGHGHAEGWPFPLWNQSGGIGWQFTFKDEHYRQESGLHTVDQKGFETRGIEDGGITEDDGWRIKFTEPRATLTTPPFQIGSESAVFIKLAWRTHGMDDANPFLEWTTADSPEFDASKRVYFSPLPESRGFCFTMIPVNPSPYWKGKITRLRINFDNPAGASADIRYIITALDTRHDINNSNFVAGCCTYFAWTRNLTFLRQNIQRMRLAMHYITDVLGTKQHKCVVPPWPGHDGRSGLEITRDGKKILHFGRGIGNNYWDIMPFGGEDCLATIYAYNAMQRLAELEEQIPAHPEWNLPRNLFDQDADFLRKHSSEVRDFGQKHFWNESTGRFVGAIDCDGVAHDYGFTFLNLEAIYYDFASKQQAQSILAWVSGKRVVEQDTSQGADIYHWRFAPRATTRRNVDWYLWAWNAPESIPFGYQVQDGGAVLGWSYHDLMARLVTLGPDDAASRLAEIIKWFDEVLAAGGYREYYKDHSRGTLQGADVPGGLGLDKEFVESILPPQVMLYGFLGFRASADGFTVHPRLPKDWPKLTITRIHFQDEVIEIEATRDAVHINGLTPERWKQVEESAGIRVTRQQ